MKKRFYFLTILLSVLFIGQNADAQSLLTAQEVAKLLPQKNVVVVSARKKTDYAKVHVRGAINIDLNELHAKTPVEGMLKSKEEVATILGEKGITSDKKVIIYCTSGVNAGRLFWILKYMGCKDVAIMNGQMSAWRAARKPVTGAPTPAKKATFTPAVNSKVLATKSYMKSKMNSSSTVLVDARKAEDFAAGHIGNAKHINYKDLKTDKHILKSKAEMQAIFDKAGITKSKEVILYCKTGTIAGFLFFVLTEELGYTNVKLYDGSYNEWKS